MNHMTSRLLKLRGVGISASAALLSTLFACSGDDTNTVIVVSDASCSTTSSSASSSSSSTATVTDAAADVSSEDAARDSGALDGTMADVSVGPPAALNLCGTLDAIFNVTPVTRNDPWGWVPTVVLGPSNLSDGATSSSDLVGWDGYENLVGDDCNVSDIFNASFNDDGGIAWANNVRAWEQRILGCTTEPDAGPEAGLPAGLGFGLVPPELYGQLLTTADLKRLGDYYVEALIQAVANQVSDPDNLPNQPQNVALLTGDQIDAIQQWVAYEETLYPSVDTTVSAKFSHSTCPDGG
jgi:hypothetical protein